MMTGWENEDDGTVGGMKSRSVQLGLGGGGNIVSSTKAKMNAYASAASAADAAAVPGPLGTRRYRRLPIFWVLRKLTAWTLYVIEGIAMGRIRSSVVVRQRQGSASRT